MDQFDRDSTFHVCVCDGDATVGYARLLPTTEPYLLSEVFPELMDGALIPKSSAVWEISRVCSVDLRSPGEHGRQADFGGFQAVMRAAVQCALEHGVSRLIAVSPAAMERLVSRLGVNASRASPTMQLHGHSVFAFWTELDDMTKNALGITVSAA
jgi:N-acyl-L-homoserine lactone synthetase